MSHSTPIRVEIQLASKEQLEQIDHEVLQGGWGNRSFLVEA